MHAALVANIQPKKPRTFETPLPSTGALLPLPPFQASDLRGLLHPRLGHLGPTWIYPFCHHGFFSAHGKDDGRDATNFPPPQRQTCHPRALPVPRPNPHVTPPARRRHAAFGATVLAGFGWAVLDTQRSLWAETKTAHHDSCGRRCFAPPGALTRPRLSRFALHFALPNGYLDSGFLV